MFINRNKNSVLYKTVAMAVVCLFLFNDIAFALAPQLSTASGKEFRDEWLLEEVSSLIAQMLEITRARKLQNPRELLVPRIRQLFHERGRADTLSAVYDIDGIEEVREAGAVTGFTLPVKESGALSHKLLFNLSASGTISVTKLPISPQQSLKLTSGEAGEARHELRGISQGIVSKLQMLQEGGLKEAAYEELIEPYKRISEIVEDNQVIDLLRYIYSKFSDVYITEVQEKIREEIPPVFKYCETSEDREPILKNISLLMKMARLLCGCYIGQEAWVKANTGLNDILAYPLLRQKLKKITSVDFKAGAISIYTDEVALFQVIRNLLDNALESTVPDRKNSIVIRTELSDGGTSVLIQVEDHGEGISAENIEKFKKGIGFTTKGDGHGIGLRVVKKLVETRLGGTIEVASELGKGTTFTLRLPVAGAPGSRQAIRLPVAGDARAQEHRSTGAQDARSPDSAAPEARPAPAYQLVYDLLRGDVKVQIREGATVYVKAEKDIRRILEELSYLKHDVNNALAGFEWGLKFYQNRGYVTPQLSGLVVLSDEISRVLEKKYGLEDEPDKLGGFNTELKAVIEKSRNMLEYRKLKAIFEEAYGLFKDSDKTAEIRIRHIDLMIAALLYAKNVLSDCSLVSKEPPKTVNLNALLDSVSSLRGNIFRMVVKEYAAGEIEIVTDEAGLTRALANIVLNASDAINESKGSGGFRMRTQIANDKKHVEIILADTTGGISPEALSHIFEKGFTTKPFGKGLGLAIAKEYIEKRCGGTIDVASEVGKGTTFTIRLPIAQPVSAVSVPEIDYDRIIERCKEILEYFDKHKDVTDEQFIFLKEQSKRFGMPILESSSKAFRDHLSDGSIVHEIKAISLFAELSGKTGKDDEYTKEDSSINFLFENQHILHEIMHIIRALNTFSIAVKSTGDKTRGMELERRLEEWRDRFVLVSKIFVDPAKMDKRVVSMLADMRGREMEQGVLLIREAIDFLSRNKNTANTDTSEYIDDMSADLEGLDAILYLVGKIRISRGDKGDRSLLNMNEVIKNSAKAVLTPYIRKAGLVLDTDLDAAAPASQLSSDAWFIWTNLATNACDAIKERCGGSLYGKQAEATEKKVTIKSKYDAQRGILIVTFADTGNGIKPENISRIWEKGFTTKETGTGFGLYAVKEIVEKNGGTIEVASEVGKGTTFTLRLPVAGAPGSRQAIRLPIAQKTDATSNITRRDFIKRTGAGIAALLGIRKAQADEKEERIAALLKQLTAVPEISREGKEEAYKKLFDILTKWNDPLEMPKYKSSAEEILKVCLEKAKKESDSNCRAYIVDILRWLLLKGHAREIFPVFSGILKKESGMDDGDGIRNTALNAFEDYLDGQVEAALRDTAVTGIRRIAENNDEKDLIRKNAQRIYNKNIAKFSLPALNYPAKDLPKNPRRRSSLEGAPVVAAVAATASSTPATAQQEKPITQMTVKELYEILYGLSSNISLHVPKTSAPILKKYFGQITEYYQSIIQAMDELTRLMETGESFDPGRFKLQCDRLNESIVSMMGKWPGTNKIVRLKHSMMQPLIHLASIVDTITLSFENRFPNQGMKRAEIVKALDKSKQIIKVQLEIIKRYAIDEVNTPAQPTTIGFDVKKTTPPTVGGTIHDNWKMLDPAASGTAQGTQILEPAYIVRTVAQRELQLVESELKEMREIVASLSTEERLSVSTQEKIKTLMSAIRNKVTRAWDFDAVKNIISKLPPDTPSEFKKFLELFEYKLEHPIFSQANLCLQSQCRLILERGYIDEPLLVAIKHTVIHMDTLMKELLDARDVWFNQTKSEIHFKQKGSGDFFTPVTSIILKSLLQVAVGGQVVALSHPAQAVAPASFASGGAGTDLTIENTTPPTVGGTIHDNWKMLDPANVNRRDFLRAMAAGLTSFSRALEALDKIAIPVKAAPALSEDAKGSFVWAAEGFVDPDGFIYQCIRHAQLVRHAMEIAGKVTPKNMEFAKGRLAGILPELEKSVNGAKEMIARLQSSQRKKELIEELRAYLRFMRNANESNTEDVRGVLDELIGASDKQLEALLWGSIKDKLNVWQVEASKEVGLLQKALDAVTKADSEEPKQQESAPKDESAQSSGINEPQTTHDARRTTHDEVTAESETAHATNFNDAVKFMQAQPQSQPLIIALGTSWIKGYKKDACLQYDALNPLLSGLANYRGNGSVAVIVKNDKELLAEIKAKTGQKDFEGARIVALASEDTIVNELAEFAQDDKNVLVGVDNRDLTEDSYIRIIEMLTLAMRLAINPDLPPNSPDIPAEKRGKFWIFIPRAEPMNYERLRPIYAAQRSA